LLYLRVVFGWGIVLVWFWLCGLLCVVLVKIISGADGCLGVLCFYLGFKFDILVSGTYVLFVEALWVYL